MMDLSPNSSQLELSTTDSPITATTFRPESVNLPLAIALPICLFFFFAFVIILIICLVRKKKCSQKPVEPPMSRGSVEGCSDNGDNNNNIDGETNNHQTRVISTDVEILEVGAKSDAYDAPPEEQQNIICERTPEEQQNIICERTPEEQQNIICERTPEEQQNIICERTPEEQQNIICERTPEEQQNIICERTPEEQQNIICERTPEESFCLQRNQDEKESTTGTIVDGKENPMPAVEFEHKASAVAMQTAAVAPPLGQQSQQQDTSEEQDDFQTYIAVYSFEAENEYQMSLEQNDIVLVAETEEHEGWLCGWKRNSPVTGWFPKSHVREVEQNSPGTIGSKLSDSAETAEEFGDDVREYHCRALYAYDGVEDSELSFKAGDTLVVHHGVAETGWLYGKRGDEVGWFPTTYVEVIPGLNPLKSTSFDCTTSTTYDPEAPKTDEHKQVVTPSADIIPEGSHISPSINIPHDISCSPKIPFSKNLFKRNRDDSTPPSVKSKRPSIPSGKPNISDRLRLSKIANFRIRRNSKDEPVTLKEVVLVPSPGPPGKSLCEDTLSATQQKQSKSPGKKGRKEPSRPVIPPPQAPRRQSLLKHKDHRKKKTEMPSTCNENPSSLDKNIALLDMNTGKPLTDTVTTNDEYDSSKPLGVVAEPTEDTERTKALVPRENGCVEVLEPKPLQSTADGTRRQWDIALESFDRILEETNDFNEDPISLKSTNLVPSLSNNQRGFMEKTPDPRDYSTPQVTPPDAVSGAGRVRATLQLTRPQVDNRKTSDDDDDDESRSLDADGDEVSLKSELRLLSFAPPGFNDTEEVLSPKFLSYLNQVGSIDKTRLCQTVLPLRCQPSPHPPIPPKPSWPPTSDKQNEEFNEEGDDIVSKDDGNCGTLTFIVQKGRSKRQSSSTLLLPDVVRGYTTNDEYKHLQIPPPAGFSSDSESVEETNHVSLVSLESLDSLNNFREIKTPRYFGRTMYNGPQEVDSEDDSSAFPDAKQKVCERVQVPVEDQTDTVVWKPWGHLEPTIKKSSYSEDVETRMDSFTSRHDDTSRHSVMFRLADGSVVFDELDVGLESVI